MHPNSHQSHDPHGLGPPPRPEASSTAACPRQMACHEWSTPTRGRHGMVRHNQAKYPNSLISRAGIFITKKRQGKKFSEKFGGEKVSSANGLLALGSTGQQYENWKTTRPGRRQVSIQRPPCGQVHRNEGKGFTASTKENKNSSQNGVSACAGWDVLWAWAMNGVGRQILHML